MWWNSSSASKGIEFNRVDAPRLTPSMRSALSDLKLDKLLVIYPGSLRYPITERVEAVQLTLLASPDFAVFVTAR